MTIVLPALAIAFATFCVWLTMRIVDRREPKIATTICRADDVLAFLSSITRLPAVSRIPSPVDDRINELISDFSESDSEEKRRISATISQLHGSHLLVFARRMAAHAVRIGEPNPIKSGLAAIALSYPVVDHHDALRALSLLHRSCEKLGLGPCALFADSGGCGDEDSGAFILSFVTSRNEPARTIEVMGFVEGKDKFGFNYVSTREPNRNVLQRLLRKLGLSDDFGR